MFRDTDPYFGAPVTLVLQKMGQRGLVRYSRGRVEIADGPELERASCECYGTVKAEFDRLLSPLQV